jgi:hypothetical protein
MVIQIEGCNVTTSLIPFEGVDGPLIVLECPYMRVIIRADELVDIKVKDLDYIEIEITRANGDTFVIRNDDLPAYRTTYVVIAEFLKRINGR